MRAAAARGKRAGNLGLHRGDPAAIRKLSEARRAGHLGKLIAGAETWLPEVRRLRGEGRSWDDVVRYLNARRPGGTPAWTQERLVRGVRRFIAEGLAEKDLLTPAERAPAPGRRRAA